MSQEEILLIVFVVGVLLILSAFTIIFVIAFQKRKNKFLVDKLEAEKRFEKELANTQLEIQEQTFKNIAWELHDNVGQLLSVANMQLNMLRTKAPDELKQAVDDTKSVVTDSVQEIRSLSKILNNDVILKNGLEQSIKTELERFERLSFLIPHFERKGEVRPIQSSNEIILFRILQEFFSNVIKHAKAKNLFVLLDYKEKGLTIQVKDDGVGFDMAQHQGNSGMHTMKSRAQLVQAEFELTSEAGKGTDLLLTYPYEQNNA